MEKEKELTISFRCLEKLKVKLVKTAKKEDRSVSWIIKNLIKTKL